MQYIIGAAILYLLIGGWAVFSDVLLYPHERPQYLWKKEGRTFAILFLLFLWPIYRPRAITGVFLAPVVLVLTAIDIIRRPGIIVSTAIDIIRGLRAMVAHKRLFASKEVKAFLGVLDEADQRFRPNYPVFELVKNRIEQEVLAQPDATAANIRNGLSPQQAVYSMIANISGDLCQVAHISTRWIGTYFYEGWGNGRAGGGGAGCQ